MFEVVRTPMVIVDWLLGNFQFYRKYKGGHWEHWSVGNFGVRSSDVWLPVDKCSLLVGGKPHPYCHGYPLLCEEDGISDTSNRALFCRCGRNLDRAPSAFSGDDIRCYIAHCECGTISEWDFTGTVPSFIRESKNSEESLEDKG